MSVINDLELRSVCVRWEVFSVLQLIVAMVSFLSLVSEELNVMNVRLVVCVRRRVALVKCCIVVDDVLVTLF